MKKNASRKSIASKSTKSLAEKHKSDQDLIVEEYAPISLDKLCNGESKLS